MPETIGFDARLWGHPGIGRYIRELLTALLRLEKAGRYRLLIDRADESEVRGSLGREAKLVRARSAVYSAFEQAELGFFSQSVSLLHVPHFNVPIFCRSKLVATIHDLIYLKADPARRFYTQFLMRGIEKRADRVIAVSDFTRREFESAFPGASGKTDVVHEAAAEHFHAKLDPKALDRARVKFGLPEDYFLFVGSLKPHKNLPFLIEAMGALRSRKNVDVQLAVVGKKDPKEPAIVDRLEQASSYCRYLGEQSDENLRELYQGARALVMPSLWEGFGLPALEAMACGTPVVASDRASLPEVVGDAGILFDPTRVDPLCDILYNILMDKGLRERLSRKGLQRVRLFEWRRAARQTLDVYEKALGSVRNGE